MDWRGPVGKNSKLYDRAAKAKKRSSKVKKWSKNRENKLHEAMDRNIKPVGVVGARKWAMSIHSTNACVDKWNAV